MSERSIELGIASTFSGVDCTVTRKGLRIGGWYDSIVGIQGWLIPWDELNVARAKVDGKEPIEESEKEHRRVEW